MDVRNGSKEQASTIVQIPDKRDQFKTSQKVPKLTSCGVTEHINYTFKH